MDGKEIRKRLMVKLSTGKAIIFSSDDKFALKLSKSSNFTYIIIMDHKIYYIVHEAQDDGSVKDGEKVVTMDPDGTLKKMVEGKKLFSPHPELVRSINVEKINIDHIFRKPYDDELTLIKEGAALLDRALEISINKISLGMKEYEIRAEIDYAIAKMGFDSFSYNTFVLVGDKTSVPLGKTGERTLEKGDLIQIDASPIYKGYDLSIARVVFTEFNDEMKEIWKKYNRVFEIISPHLKPGTSAGMLDSITRDYISSLGFSFPHYSGYPLGGFTAPNLYPGSDDYLERNSVFVFSPGLYVKNKYGFRIKRMVHITDESFETLDKFGV